MLKRVIWHWTAGGWNPNEIDREHYHFLIDGDGVGQAGEHEPEDNVSTADDDYAAHTKQLNTGSIGVAVCCMAGAVERPFDPGRYPMREAQVETMLDITARLCQQYGITVGRTTTLSHAEVEPTLGVKQNGKWDICWVPGMMNIGTAIGVGDELRARLAALMVPGPPPLPDRYVPVEDELLARVEALEAWVRSFPGKTGV